QLKNVQSKEQVLELFKPIEDNTNEPEETIKDVASRPFLVAVTACPTGIAHTFMAADSLKLKAKEMGVEIKVETNGSEGIKNKLTKEDIARASAVIVAADKKVEMNRFDGKQLINR